jgi:hypothetical protein
MTLRGRPLCRPRVVSRIAPHRPGLGRHNPMRPRVSGRDRDGRATPSSRTTGGTGAQSSRPWQTFVGHTHGPSYRRPGWVRPSPTSHPHATGDPGRWDWSCRRTLPPPLEPPPLGRRPMPFVGPMILRAVSTIRPGRNAPTMRDEYHRSGRRIVRWRSSASGSGPGPTWVVRSISETSTPSIWS